MPRDSTSAGTRIFTARLPEAEYEALRAYAFLTATSMNDVVVSALRAFLAEHAREHDIDAARERFRSTVKRLKRDD